MAKGPSAGLVGDITPTCGVSDEEKHALESAGIQKLKAMLGGGPAADEMEELWREYEAGESIEAALVKDFDKVRALSRIVTLHWLDLTGRGPCHCGAPGFDTKVFRAPSAAHLPTFLVAVGDDPAGARVRGRAGHGPPGVL